MIGINFDDREWAWTILTQYPTLYSFSEVRCVRVNEDRPVQPVSGEESVELVMIVAEIETERRGDWQADRRTEELSLSQCEDTRQC